MAAMMGRIMAKKRNDQPLVYSCSGCSSAAQMTNHIALGLDRLGVAEMSCIAGVGGGVPGLVRIARSGRPIVALDGCPLHCARHCLDRHGIVPDVHVDLSRLGVKKKIHKDFDREEADRHLVMIRAKVEALGSDAVSGVE